MGNAPLNYSNVINMELMFSYAGSDATIFSLDLSGWDVSNVTNFKNMFERAGFHSTIFNLDVSDWDTSNVTDMSCIFMFAAGEKTTTTFEIKGLDTWDVSNVTNMREMFACTSGSITTTWSIGDLSNWDVSNVTDMSCMFEHTGYSSTNYSLGDISQWNVSNVTSMRGMFNYAGKNATPFTLDLSGWDASKVTTISGMFHEIGANKILTPKNIKADVDIKGEYWSNDITTKTWYDTTDGNKEYPAGTFPVGNSNVSHVLVDEKPKTYNLVDGPTFNIKIGKVESTNKIKSVEFVDTKMPTSGVTEITGIDSDGDNGVVGWYVVDPVDNMAKVYISTQETGQKAIADPNCYEFLAYLMDANYIDARLLDTSNVTNMERMLHCVGREGITTILKLNNWDTSNVTNMESMFESSGNFVKTYIIEGLSDWDTSNVTNMERMFFDAGYHKVTTFDIGDISNWDTSSVTNMYMAFLDTAPKADYHLDLSNWNVDKVTKYSYFSDETKVIPPIWKN